MRLLRRLTVFVLVLLLLAGVPHNSALAAGYATLKLGDSGTEVRKMQTALIAQNYLSDTADGRFGPKTQEAVKSFQRGNSLKVDGLAGNQTLTRLYGLAETGSNATNNTASNPTPGTDVTLVYGNTGNAVQSMQSALTSLGYNTGGTDGKFGQRTLSAVQAFQKANSLTADGKAGTATLAKLYALAGNGGNPQNDTTATLSRTLRLNSTGSDVRLLQTKLAGLDYSLEINGTYDSKTISAVREFQRLNKLTADGIAGTQTFRALLSDSAVKAGGTPDVVNPPAAFSTLRSGASGEAVRALQRQLAALEYKIEETGKYDSQTIQAVRSFQTINKLTVDGVAGSKTQSHLYSGNAIKYSAQSNTYSAPSIGQIKLLHWFDEVKPALRGKSSIYVHDPASGNGFTLSLYSLGNHADVEPRTAEDTAKMMAAFGGQATWTPKFVYVRLPDGTWTAATMHNVAHGGQSIPDNDFNGQNCVHFLRDIEEVTRNDPDYGVTNQLALRKGWQNLTGKTVE